MANLTEEAIGDEAVSEYVASLHLNLTELTAPTIDGLSPGQIILTIFFALLTLTTILANLFILLIFFLARRKLRSPTSLLLANLAVADLLVGLVVMPLLAATTVLHGKWIHGQVLCQAFDYIHFLLCASSMWSMIGVGIDRYIGVTRPLQYKFIMTRKRTSLMILLIWLTALSFTSGPLSYWPKKKSGIPTICFANLIKDFLLFVIFFAYWIPVTTIMIVYYLVYRAALTPFIKKPGETVQKEEEMEASKSKQIRLAKNIALVTGTLLLFYAPVFLLFTVKAFELPFFSKELLFLCAWIRYGCSTVNPFMYGLAMPSFKQEIKERISKIFKRK